MNLKINFDFYKKLLLKSAIDYESTLVEIITWCSEDNRLMDILMMAPLGTAEAYHRPILQTWISFNLSTEK